MYEIPQSTTTHPLVFFMAQSADKTTGVTGLTPTVTIRKVGGSFASPAGAVSEIANGWYQVAGNATDSDTLGPLLLHATGTGADPVDAVYDVVVPRPTATAITNFNTVFSTDFATNYDATNDLWNANVDLVKETDPDTYFTDEAGTAAAVWAVDPATVDDEDTMGNFVQDLATAAQVVQVDTVVDGLATTLGAAGAGLTAVPWNAAWDAEAQSEAQDAITASLTAIASAILDADYASPAEDSWLERLVEIGTTVDTVNTLVVDIPQVIDQGTAQSATATTLVLRAAAGFADDDLINASVLITGGSTGVGQVRKITDYVGSTDTATVAAWTTTPTGTITYQIIPGSGGNTEAEITEWVENAAPAPEFFGNQPEVVAGDPTEWATYKGKIDGIDTATGTTIPDAITDGFTVVAVSSAAAQAAAESTDGKLTSGRLSKIDRIQDTGTVAASSEVSGIALANLTAEKIAPGRTFRVAWEGNRSDNIVTLNTWSSGTVTLAADFDGSNKSNGLNPGTTISSLDSVTVTNQADETTVTTSELRVQQTLTAVNFDVAAIAAAGRFTVVIEVTTSDSQTLSMVGELVVQAP